MRDGFAFTLLMLRTGAAILLTLGLVVFLLVVYLRDGTARLAEAFQILQGVLLSTLAYLFTVHAADRAEATVLSERRKRDRMVEEVEAEAAGTRAVRVELEFARRLLQRLEKDPAIGRRVQELARQVAGEEPE